MIKNQKIKILLVIGVAVLCQFFTLYVGWSIAEDYYVTQLQECGNELVKPNKCGKLWNYAVSLEEENARLNQMCREKMKK